jgi:hypothetical protein
MNKLLSGLSLLFVALVSAGLASAAPVETKFSIDPASPTIDGDITPDDVLEPGPVVHTQGTALGLRDNFFSGDFDNLNALSYGRDPIQNPLYFSVDRVAVGLPGSAVHSQAQPGVEEASADVYRALPPFGSNSLVIDEQELGLVPAFLNPDGDDLDGLELDTVNPQHTYFSIDFLSSSNGFGTNSYANDIYCDFFVDGAPDGGCGSLKFAEGEVRMHLYPDDDIDGLILWDVFQPGILNPGIDQALFSLTQFSPSTFTFTGNQYIPGVQDFLSPADILFTDFTGGFTLWASAEAIGLRPDDNLDALDTIPEPSSIFLLLAGFGSLWAVRAKKTAI